LSLLVTPFNVVVVTITYAVGGQQPDPGVAVAQVGDYETEHARFHWDPRLRVGGDQVEDPVLRRSNEVTWLEGHRGAPDG